MSVIPQKLCVVPDNRFGETMIHRLLPPTLKRSIRLLQRRLRDRSVTFAKKRGTLNGHKQLLITQQIKRTNLFENKVHNLKLGAKKIETIVIQPGEVFSFWSVLGNPSVKNGYKTGRNIVNGVLQEAVGGGLCQLSGIIYHAALLAGFEVTERFNHTVDIYKEEDRFTPLGADATVVYGYKDLRFRNNLKQPVQLYFVFGEEEISCGVLTQRPITIQQLEFRRSEEAGKRVVETRNKSNQQIATSVYLTN